MNYLLDTNIVSLAIKQNLKILQSILAVDAKDLIMVSNDTDLARVEGLNLENWIEL